jgi:hypothetical protein
VAEKAMNGRWFVALGLFVGLITGGLGSAAIGNMQYQKVTEKFDNLVHEDHQDDMSIRSQLSEIRERLARIEALLEDR